MSETPRKCAIVLAEHLPIGLAVNAACALSVTLGAKVDGLVGVDVEDAAGATHPGVICTPLPVLVTSTDRISQILAAAAAENDLFFATFSSLAQSCKTYDEYIERMRAVETEEIEIIGIVLFGLKKRVNKLVGSLPLFR